MVAEDTRGKDGDGQSVACRVAVAAGELRQDPVAVLCRPSTCQQSPSPSGQGGDARGQDRLLTLPSDNVPCQRVLRVCPASVPLSDTPNTAPRVHRSSSACWSSGG